MERRDYRGMSDPDMGYQRKEADRIRAIDGGWAITVQPGDTGVAMAQTNEGIRAEVLVKLAASGIVPGSRTIWGRRYKPIGPQTRAAWGSKGQLHGPNRTGQATLFLTTLDGFWDMRFWAADTQRRADQARIVDAAGMPLACRDGEEVLVVWELMASPDPRIGYVHLNVNGVDQGRVEFATLHTKRLDGSVIAAADQGAAVKEGLYTNDRSRPWSIEVTDLCRFTGQDATIPKVLAAMGFIVPGPPPTVPTDPPADPCAGLRAQLSGALAEADSLELARDAAQADANAKQRRLNAVIREAMDDPADPND